MLTDGIAYLKLSSVQAARSAGYIQSRQVRKGLIIDIRNYPSEFVVFTTGTTARFQSHQLRAVYTG